MKITYIVDYGQGTSCRWTGVCYLAENTGNIWKIIASIRKYLELPKKWFEIFSAFVVEYTAAGANLE